MRQPVPFGKYLLLDRISVGGMAEVFKAKSYGVEGFEKIIAIKRILPTMGEDRDFIKMFIDEAKIAGQLAHANICQIFELGRIDGSHFIAMEYIWGKDLLQIQNRLRKIKQQMPVPMACFSIAKVLEGLDYAHRKRDPLGRPLEIVHRDCSPQNVLVSYEGEVKVIDFGIAKATSRNSRTMAGVLKGKFGYMSPEQVRGLPLDRRSDIFALGTMLYECLTGERLFQGETDFSTLEKVRNVDIQAPRAINPNIPEAVEAVILKALAKDVEDRYQWCSEMLADLQQYLMSQEAVFTAKSLSSWLKETFAQEIERERQQLEQYKRVGRDGLIAGVPAAEAKLDVVEHLGEAGAPEGDATVLGGPSFDDVEQIAGAAPDPTQSPSAMRGSKPMATQRRDEDDAGDFGEEAPTEIFGELGDGALPPDAAPPPAAGRAPTAGMGSRPPKPPPGRPATQRPNDSPQAPPGYGQPMQPGFSQPLGQPMAAAPMTPPPMARQPSGPMPLGMPDGMAQPQAYPQQPQMYPSYAPAGGSNPPPMGLGTPGSMPVSDPQQMNGLAQQNQPQGRTVLGVQAPPGLGNYGAPGQSGGYRPSPSSQPPMQGMQMPPGMSQQMPMGYPQYPSYPPGYMQQPGMPGMPGMQGMPGGQPHPAAEAPAEGKKSTLVRDILIGVAIAALVLVGFLVVKLFVLDSGDKTGGSGSGSAPASSIATIRLGLPPGITVQMFVDDKVAANAVRDKDEVPVSAGLRRVKLVGPNNQACDEPIKLEAGQTTTVECTMMAGSAAAPATGSAAAPATGSAAAAAAGSAAAPAAGSAAAPATGSAAAPASGAGAGVGAVTASGVSGTQTDDKAKPELKTVPKPETKPETKPDTKPETKPVAKVETKPAVVETKPAVPAKPAVVTPTPTDTGGGSGNGYLQVFSKPAAKILVDGSDSGKSTPVSGHALSLAPGKHKITFVIGDDRFTYPVNIKAGQTETMSKDLE